MGQYEDQLRSIGQATDWSIPELSRLISGFEDLIAAMGKLTGAVGWTGESADLAIHKFAAMRSGYAATVDALVDVRRQISDANAATSFTRVSDLISRLPSAHMPTDEHALKLLVGAFFPPIPIVGLVLAEQDVQRVEAQLRAKREAAAYHDLLMVRKEIGVLVLPTEVFPDPIPPYVDDDDDWNSSGGGPSGIGTGSWSGSGYGTGGPNDNPDHGGDDNGNDVDGHDDGGNDDKGDDHGDDTVDTYVDSNLDPSLAGSRSGGFGGGSLGGGGLGSGLAGVGVAGGAGAALAGASRMANGGAGALGAAGAGKAGANNAMMGSPGGGGAGSNKNKRSGLGLVAPKLEDDETVGPKSAGARAGGRDNGGTDK
jgi:hypothetical protein